MLERGSRWEDVIPYGGMRRRMARTRWGITGTEKRRRFSEGGCSVEGLLVCIPQLSFFAFRASQVLGGGGPWSGGAYQESRMRTRGFAKLASWISLRRKLLVPSNDRSEDSKRAQEPRQTPEGRRLLDDRLGRHKEHLELSRCSPASVPTTKQRGGTNGCKEGSAKRAGRPCTLGSRPRSARG